MEEITMGEGHLGRWAGVAAVAASLCLGGCAALDAAAVAETHRLEEGEFYVDVGSGAHRVAGRTLLLPAVLDPALADVMGYGGRAAEFAPPEGEQQVLPQDQFPPGILHLRRPSAAWQQATKDLLAREGASHAVVVALGVSQYPKGREGMFGKKVVLGTGHDEPIRFLTAEDKLLEVLQFTGVLVDAQGRVVRAGAEGILARDTPFAAQVFDVDKVLDDRTLEQVLTVERRADLAGDPLKWEVALGNLLAGLRADPAGRRVP